MNRVFGSAPTDPMERRLAKLETALKKIAASAEYKGADSVSTKLGRAIDIARLALAEDQQCDTGSSGLDAGSDSGTTGVSTSTATSGGASGAGSGSTPQ